MPISATTGTTAGAAPGTGPDAAKRRAPRPGAALAVIILAQLMFILDGTVVNVALPAVRADLGFGAAGLTWVVTGYALAFGGFLLLGGRAGDVLGRRRMFMAGIAVFIAASAAGGAAQEPGQLIAARVVQGLGAAAASPSTLALITTMFRGERLTRALSVFSATAGGGATVGLLLGGVLVEWGSWRWTLFVNVPIGLVALVLAPRFVAESERHAGRFDLAGALLSVTGVTALVYAFTRASEPGRGWTDGWTLAAFAAAAVLLAGFVANERAVAQPIMPLRLFADRARAGAFAGMALLPSATFAVFYFITLYLQGPLRYSPLRTGLAFAVMTAPMLAVTTARVAPRAMAAIGARRTASAGALLVTGGLVWLGLLRDGDGFAAAMLGPLLLVGVGVPLAFSPLNVAILGSVVQGDAGAASGALQALQQTGAALGLAVLATVSASAGGTMAHAISLGFVVAAAITATVALTLALTLRPATAA